MSSLQIALCPSLTREEEQNFSFFPFPSAAAAVVQQSLTLLFFPKKLLPNPRHKAWLTFCGGRMKKDRAETLPSFVNKSWEKNSCFEFKENVFIWKTNNFLKDLWLNEKYFLLCEILLDNLFCNCLSHLLPCSVAGISAGTEHLSLCPFPCKIHGFC